MKKNIMFSVIVTIFINFGLFLFNLSSVYNTHHLPLSVKINGGEYMAERGFGILIEKIYPLTTMSEEGVRETITFDFISLLIPMVITFIVVFIIFTIVSKFKKISKNWR